MTPRVRRDGGWLRKALPDAASGPRLARRSQLLAACGVRTPVAHYDALAQEIVLPWIAGTSGRDMLRRHCRDTASGGPVSESFLATCLLPLARLHEVDPAGLDLVPLDPWRRIDARLAEACRAEESGTAGEIGRAAWRTRRSTARRLAETGERLRGAPQVVAHGDYHVGQLLFASPTAEPWLLDLDDLALAPRESDLGNFAAHLSTIDERATKGACDAFHGLTSLICPLYGASARHEVDHEIVEVYGAIALLRRALKLRERGAGSGLVVDLLDAAERLNEGSALAAARLLA